MGCLQVLLDFGADVNNQDRAWGTTSFMSAADSGRVECMRLLVENNADVDCKDEDGATGLMVAACNGHSNCLKVLIEANANMG
jgi:ankyrin repeat protein